MEPSELDGPSAVGQCRFNALVNKQSPLGMGKRSKGPEVDRKVRPHGIRMKVELRGSWPFTSLPC